MDICQLSRSFKHYDGRLVAVRGVYCGGLKQRCEQNCTSGEPWPSHVDLIEASGLFPVGFRTDHTSVGELTRVVKELGRRRQKGVEVWVTVVGQLRAEYESSLGPCDRVGGGHYGHLGAYPAQLIIRDVKDIVVKEVPDPSCDFTRFLNPYPLGNQGPGDEYSDGKPNSTPR